MAAGDPARWRATAGHAAEPPGEEPWGVNAVSRHHPITLSLRETWPLLTLRYCLLAAGVCAWLLEAQRTAGFVAGSMFFALAVLLDLAVHGGGEGPQRAGWACLQTGLALAATAARPGIAAAIVLSAFLTGGAAVTPWALAGALGAAAAAVTILLVDASASVHLGVVSLYGLAIAAGQLFAQRGRERRQYEETVARFEEAEARLSTFTETARDLAVARERQHMAEELHDTLGHALVGTLLQLQVAKKWLRKDADAAEARLRDIEDHIRGTLDQVRQALRRGPRRRSLLPLHAALEALAADFAAAGGPEVHLVLRPDPESVSDVSADVADVLYRTAQEALTNAVRHGRATRIRLEAEAVGPRLFLRITDNGVGADQYTPGLGIQGMVHRIQTVGGTLRFETAPGAGFTVEVGVKRR